MYSRYIQYLHTVLHRYTVPTSTTMHLLPRTYASYLPVAAAAFCAPRRSGNKKRGREGLFFSSSMSRVPAFVRAEQDLTSRVMLCLHSHHCQDSSAPTVQQPSTQLKRPIHSPAQCMPAPGHLVVRLPRFGCPCRGASRAIRTKKSSP